MVVGGWRGGGGCLRRLRLRGAILCPGGDVAPGPGGALRGHALRYLPLRAGECPRTPPFPREIPQDPALPRRGLAGRGEFDPFIQYTAPLMEEGSGDPSGQPDTWIPPPRPLAAAVGRKRGGGGLKDQASFLLLPLLGDGPPAPSLPPSSPPRPGLAGPRTAGQGAGGRGEGARAWLPYRQLGAAQGVRAACGASRWAGMGEARLCGEGGAPWHGLARFGTVLPGCAPPTHTHPTPPQQQRNRRGKPAGKVNCKNMKQDCPVPACPRATLLPGHCCHTCPKGEACGEPPPCTHRVPRGHGKGGTVHAPSKRAARCVMEGCL